MGDLIDRDNLIKEIKKWLSLVTTGVISEENAIEDFVSRIENLPAVDLEPVVYCRDCVLWKPVDKYTGKCPFLIGKHQYTGAEHFVPAERGRRRRDSMALIDREKLLEFAHNHIGGVIDCNDIARFPTVDAEPVRRGEWLVNGIALQCPLCKKMLVVEQADEGLRYCPFCGAKMVGAE